MENIDEPSLLIIDGEPSLFHICSSPHIGKPCLLIIDEELIVTDDVIISSHAKHLTTCVRQLDILESND
jgi:hypothetical protein